jgi:hypothetical protein
MDFIIALNRLALLEDRLRPRGVSLEGLGGADTTNPIQVDHTPAVTMLRILIALIHSQIPL